MTTMPTSPSPDEDETRSITRDYYYSIIPEALLDSAVSHIGVRLYGVLDRYAGANRLAYPSRKTLANRLQCSLSTLDRAIEELVSAGFLTVKPSYRSNGGKRPSLYILHTSPTESPAQTHTSSMTHGGMRHQ